MNRMLLLKMFALSMFCLLPSPGQAVQYEKIGVLLQDELVRAGAGEKIPIIVRMKDQMPVSPLSTQARKRGPLRTQARSNLIRALKSRATQSNKPLQTLLQNHGITKAQQLWLINGMAFEATPSQIDEISGMADVASIVVDQAIKLPRVMTPQASTPVEPNIDQVKAPSLWDLGFTGQGVTVAIVDSGVDINHPDLASRYRGGDNSWYDPNNEYPEGPVDTAGHGTQVAGLVLGGNNSGNYIGVAPDARWIGIKIFANNGLALSSVIHLGFEWLLDPDGDPDTDDAPDIVNNSWGDENSPNLCDDLSKQFLTDVQTMKAAGIIVLFSAGNTGPSNNTSVAPANYPESFAVGSVDTTSQISFSSARGPSACDLPDLPTIYPEVVAPGAQVWTSNLTSGSPYIAVDGTSFSAPHASGVMALLLSALPTATINDLETALKQSATDLGIFGPDNTYGFGLIDSLAAYNFMTGREGIDVTDSISPENDRSMEFGSVSLGSSVTANVRVRNSSSVDLILATADTSSVLEPFRVKSDNCSNQILPAGVACSIVLEFSPTESGSFSASLGVLSNASNTTRVTVNLSGVVNAPPVAPQPLAPADGATVDTSVTFSWLPGSDSDGDVVSQYLIYSPHADFSFATTKPVETIPASVLGAGGLLLGGLLAGLIRRRNSLLALLLATLIFAIVACNGPDEPPSDGTGLPENAQSVTINGLVSGTTYYWKMLARDSKGAETESEVRTIIVK